jgi:hypothetical protein
MSRGEGTGITGGRLLLAVFACLVGLIAAGGTAHAYVPTGSDFRISNVFTDTDATRAGTDSAVAYNSSANEFLVVFRADVQADNEFEIYGRRVNAAGAPLGVDFRISNVGNDLDATRDAEAPDVAFNAASGEYLVVWSGDQIGNEEHEIYLQRVSAAGVPHADGDVRVSNVDPGGPERDAELPSVSADPEANRYLVSWQADDDEVDDKLEIYTRLVDGVGVPDPLGDERISNGAPDSVQTFDAVASDVAYNAAANEYLVVWQGEAFEAAPGVAEIWAQRVSAAGVPDDVQGDLRVSDLGSDTNPDQDGLAPALAYNPFNNTYLVVWRDDGYTGAADGEFEIFGQRMSAIGDEQLDDFRLSAVGDDGDAGRAAGAPAAAFNGTSEYLVAWDGDGLTTDDEFEVFTQRLSANGDPIGGDTRVSSAGPDGENSRHAIDPALAFGAGSNQYLATWTADDLATNNEDEIFGRRLAPVPVKAAPPPPPPRRAYKLPKKCKKKKKKKKGKSLAAAAKKKKKKKKKC